MEKAKLKVTARGNPSGMATTIIDTHKIKIFNILLTISIVFSSLLVKYSIVNCIHKAIKVIMAEPNPKYPIRSAIIFNTKL